MKRVLVLALLAAFGCGEKTLIGPSSVETGTDNTIISSHPKTTPGTANPAPGAPSLHGCDAVYPIRGQIEYRVEGTTLYLYVPVEVKVEGTPYVDVWTPEINETKLGRIRPNKKDETVELPKDPREYRIRLAVEVSSSGSIEQCDRHWFVVTVLPPPGCEGDCLPPPPPPPPPPPNPPCNVEGLEEELAQQQAACSALGGFFTGFVNAQECKVESQCHILPPPPPPPPPGECEFELPAEGTYFLQPGDRGNRECAFWGDFAITGKTESAPWGLPAADFYVCKAGTDWEVSHSPFPEGETCSNGKHRSHMLACAYECPE